MFTLSPRPSRIVRSSAARAVALVLAVAPIAACGGGGRPAPGGPVVPEPGPGGAPTTAQPDAARLYRQMGLLAEGGATPFVGSISYLAAPSPDSTLMMLTLSVPSRALTFAREGERYRASYSVRAELRSPADTARIERQEIVRVASFKETARTDESIIFRETLAMAPGNYEMRLTVRDDGGNKASAVEATVGVPRLAAGSISTPIPFYEAVTRPRPDSMPRLIASPRSTVVFGQDSIVPIYLEGYGPAAAELPVRLVARSEGSNAAVWRDSVSLPWRGALFSGVVRVPVSRLGVGVVTVSAARSDGGDSATTPLFVTFGDELPVASFREMVDYLRFFTNRGRLAALRDAPPESRATAWATFLRETDPAPNTPEHEGLRDYFSRIAQANQRFREEGSAGWLSDRGRVFVSLGNPDQVYEPNTGGMNQRGRAQIWEYRRHRLQVVFVDQTGFGRWRMTLSSQAEFEAVAQREGR